MTNTFRYDKKNNRVYSPTKIRGDADDRSLHDLMTAVPTPAQAEQIRQKRILMARKRAELHEAKAFRKNVDEVWQ